MDMMEQEFKKVLMEG